MKNDKNSPPMFSGSGERILGTLVLEPSTSEGTRPAVVVAEPKLRALRSIAVVVATLSDVVQAQIDLSEVEVERFSSLIGGLFDVLDEAGRPAERSEAERGSLTDRLHVPRHHELIEALAADVNTTAAALANMTAGFRRVADERDRLASAARVARAAMQAALDDGGLLASTTGEVCEALKVLKTALDPAPREAGRDEAPPPFDASAYERPPKVIHLDAGPDAKNDEARRVFLAAQAAGVSR